MASRIMKDLQNISGEPKYLSIVKLITAFNIWPKIKSTEIK
jgi:hypothetical protein